MKNKKGFILSTYVYILLVFFLLLLGTMLAVLNNTRILSKKLKEQSSNTSGLVNKDFSFVLLGDKEMKIFKGEDFIDPGYIIQSSGGNDLSDIVKVTGSVNNNVIDTYELTYTATYNGVTKTISRNVEVAIPTVVEKIENLYATTPNTEGLELTSDGNIRYTGSSPKNYIKFNNEDWRIIGIFNMTTSSGTTEKLMKIVRDSSIGGYSWDSSTGDNSGTHEDGEVNDGYGVNQWGEVKDSNGNITYTGADLKTELNTLYLNSQSGTCYNNSNNASTTCNFTNIGIKETYREMIESVVWNTAGVVWDASGRTGQSALTAYESERGTTTGQICKGTTYKNGASCTDTVTRTVTWEGKVGLIYPSDYGFASTNEDCRNWINASDEDKKYCKNDNWLHTESSYWTISPRADSSYSNNAWAVSSTGHANRSGTKNMLDVRPSIYLKFNVSITGGEGSSTNPYQISMNS